MLWARVGAVAMFLAVVLGAFGAHAVRQRLPPDMLSVFEVGVRYHVYHALALFVVAWISIRNPGSLTQASGWAFVVGILLFSGSLYLMTLTGTRWLGAITPIGGVAFLAGWVLLYLAASG